MPSTRASTGNSRPRLQLTVSTEPERKRKATTTAAAKPSATKAAPSTAARGRGRPKGSTNKPTATSTGAGVKKAPAHHKRKPHLSDKVSGAIEKAAGAATRNPAKKAAGTKKIRGTDGKNSRARKA